MKIHLPLGKLAGLCALLFCSKMLTGQCPHRVLHTSGTQTVGCTDVTVTFNGGAGPSPLNCGIGPYFLGFPTAGSFTFNFNPPIAGVSVDVRSINNTPNALVEEIAFAVNGAFYPITNPGVLGGCQSEAMITPTGTIGACPNCGARAWEDIVITEPMSSLTVELIYVEAFFLSGINFSLYLCCPACTTDAGVIAGNPQTICGEVPASVATAEQTVLDSNDMLQYILFADPSDTLGSILATSTAPTFPFDPATMQMGVTYYIAAIAGNDLNGTVDLNDPCLDISNAIPVTWQPLPTVVFSVANPDICAGSCTDITTTFTGTPPFVLTYISPAGPVTQTFPGYTGVFQVCTPPGSLPGSLIVQATALTDAWCACP
ncbi:MAG: hypothetical protein JNJ90_01190 [Saprospiraceae bacterium]|jgi:hypothetical protein|nr:hypothetical protein [Saprospiraceae bacterium]